MKTIKGAKGSKSNFLKWLALPILMLVAFLNIEIGGGSTPGSETRKATIGSDIGGNSVPRSYMLTTGEIGGGQETRKSPIGPNPGGNYSVSFITSDTEIGGPGSFPPRAKPIGGSQTPPRSLVNATEIGGPGNQNVPRDKPFDIGGTQTAPRGYVAIDPAGGVLNETHMDNKPYSPPAVADDSNPFGIMIGGNSAPKAYALGDTEIGGNGTPLPPRSKPGDIGGGQTVPRPFGFISSFLQDCTVDIGGNQTVPRLPFDIGGNGGGGSTAPRQYMVSI